MAIRIRKRADTLLISSLFCALRVFLTFCSSDEKEIPIATVWRVYRQDYTYVCINGRKLVMRIRGHSDIKTILLQSQKMHPSKCDSGTMPIAYRDFLFKALID